MADTGTHANNGASPGTVPRKTLPEQNPAFKAMGLPRLRLPSRNWMIFWSIVGSFTGAVVYDKWQTRRMREKWCNMVADIANEPLDTKTAPRKVTIYLAAPPGDGLRSAREHFHTYIKPVLVSAAMDWDVVEGRKEGDVRHKTAERIRKRRKLHGEGAPVPEEDQEALTVESIRAKNGDVDYPGVSGDIVVGRHTWKEYIRGLHEGYLGPPDLPKHLELWETPGFTERPKYADEHSSTVDAAVSTAVDAVAANSSSSSDPSSETSLDDASPANDVLSSAEPHAKSANEEDKEKKQEEDKPKRRFPPSYILPEDYETATISSSTPDIIGPSIGVRLPHLLGVRNTPIRIYRFLTRRKLQDDIGRQVAEAVLATHRPYGTVSSKAEDRASDASSEQPEQTQVLAYEERDWWKTVRQPRKSHEESVWIEPMALDERLTSRMRAFELTSEDEARAKRIESRLEDTVTRSQDKP